MTSPTTPATGERRADILIRNALVLTMEPGLGDTRLGMIPDGVVAVTGDTIAAVGPASGMTEWRGLKTLDAGGGIVMPGLVNAHTHAAMTCFRGLADDLPLMTWLHEHIFPAESRLTADMVYRGGLLACAEMMLSGTTCFCDMYLFEEQVAQAAKTAGVRAVVGEVLFDFPSPSYGPIEEGLAHTEDFIRRWKGDPLITVAVEPHSPYLCAPSLLERAADIARRHGAPLVIHLSETETEVNDILKRHGRRPPAHLASLGFLGPDLMACHCVAVNEEDIALLAAHDVKVVHNPESNMKLASGIAPVPAMLAAGITVGLGTDGCASNNDLDLFAEMDMAAKLHKVASLDPTLMPAETVLWMATLGGARVLGLEDRIGSLKPGKRADILLIDTRKPRLTPLYHPASALVYAASGADVDSVLIDGRIVVEHRQILTLDLEKVMADVAAIAATVVPGGHPQPPTKGIP